MLYHSNGDWHNSSMETYSFFYLRNQKYPPALSHFLAKQCFIFFCDCKCYLYTRCMRHYYGIIVWLHTVLFTLDHCIRKGFLFYVTVMAHKSSKRKSSCKCICLSRSVSVHIYSVFFSLANLLSAFDSSQWIFFYRFSCYCILHHALMHCCMFRCLRTRCIHSFCLLLVANKYFTFSVLWMNEKENRKNNEWKRNPNYVPRNGKREKKYVLSASIANKEDDWMKCRRKDREKERKWTLYSAARIAFGFFFCVVFYVNANEFHIISILSALFNAIVRIFYYHDENSIEFISIGMCARFSLTICYHHRFWSNGCAGFFPIAF